MGALAKTAYIFWKFWNFENFEVFGFDILKFGSVLALVEHLASSRVYPIHSPGKKLHNDVVESSANAFLG